MQSIFIFSLGPLTIAPNFWDVFRSCDDNETYVPNDFIIEENNLLKFDFNQKSNGKLMRPLQLDGPGSACTDCKKNHSERHKCC